MDRLFINNEEVDLLEDEFIPLSFRSNLLYDISRIEASKSYTIFLPKTARNRRIMDDATNPTRGSLIPYYKHPARYFRNGIEVLPEAIAALLDSAEHYEIFLLWGVVSRIPEWMDSGKTLKDLEGLVATAWQETPFTAYPPTEGTAFIWADYYPGIELDNDAKGHVFLYPAISVEWILNKIQQDNGFTINIPDEYRQEIRQLYIVPGERKDSAWVATNEFLRWTANKNYLQYLYISRQIFHSIADIESIKNDSEYGSLVNRSYRVAASVDVVVTSYIPKANQECRFAGVYNLYVYEDGSGAVGAAVRLCKAPARTWEFAEDIINIQPESITYAGIGSGSVNPNAAGKKLYKCTFDFSQSVNLIKDQEYYVDALVYNGRVYSAESIFASGYFQFTSRPLGRDITLTEPFDLISNLPEITQLEFVKAICNMFGLFALVDEDNANSIKLTSFDTIFGNRHLKKDWSDKLIDSNYKEPMRISFRFGDYAQSNILEYEQDDSVVMDYSGEIRVRDQTLKKKHILATIPLGASDGNVISQFSWNADKTGIDTEDFTARIMKVYDKDGVCGVSFEGLDFNDIISKYYHYYSAVLTGFVSIKEIFTLNEYDLKTLDYTIPIYLKQYGRDYAIRTINAKNDDLFEVELVQLPIIE